MVNGPDAVYVERRGRLERTGVSFGSEAELLHAIERILAPLGRRVDEAQPLCDARLADGSRVNVVIPPLSLSGPCLTVRRFRRDGFSLRDLVAGGTLPAELGEFLALCVAARASVLVSGGTGSGKTTTLNALSGAIPGEERIVTIEDAAELRLRQRHVVRLEARPANLEGRGEVTIRQLVRNALRMRPDRIVVGEVRGAEALDMLQALNTGHDGSLTTVHANSPADALRRVETLALMAGVGLPHGAVREQVASALDLVVHQARLPDGARVVESVAEVVRVAGGAGTRDLYCRGGGRCGAGRASGRARLAVAAVEEGPERRLAARVPSPRRRPASAACELGAPARGGARRARAAARPPRGRARRRAGPARPRGSRPGCRRAAAAAARRRSAALPLARRSRPLAGSAARGGRAWACRALLRHGAGATGAPWTPAWRRWRWRWRTRSAAGIRCAARSRRRRGRRRRGRSRAAPRAAASWPPAPPPTRRSRPCARGRRRRGSTRSWPPACCSGAPEEISRGSCARAPARWRTRAARGRGRGGHRAGALHGLIVVLLPLGGGLLAELASPGWFAGLRSTFLTAWLVGIAIVLQVTAAVLMRRLARVRW